MTQLLTTQQAADRLGVSDSRIRQYIAEGKIKSTRFGQRSHQLDSRDVDAFERPPMGPPVKRKKKGAKA